MSRSIWRLERETHNVQVHLTVQLRALILFVGLCVVLLASGCASGVSAQRTNGTTAPSTGSGTPANTAGGQTLTLPSDPCSLLSLAALQQAVGEAFATPTSTVANSGGATVILGATCQYSAPSGNGDVSFIIFQDPSATVAKQQFDNFKLSFPAAANGQISGLGDDAYIDTNDALHARKSNIRFYISIQDSLLADSAAIDAADKQLATGVMAQI